MTETIDQQVVEIDTKKEIARQPKTDPIKLMELAISKGADIQSLEKLMDLQERYEQRLARKAFFMCLSELQTNLPIIKKTGVVDYTTAKGRTNYTHAKLEDIAKAIKPLLGQTGLSYRFEQSVTQQLITVTCIVTHQDGHEERSGMSGFPDQSGNKNPIQQLASTVSYLRRYTLTGALGITVSDEDDDTAGQQPTGDFPQPFYSDEAFTKAFPQWTGIISGGKKTHDELLRFLEQRGVNLSDEQKTKIRNITVRDNK